MADPREPKPAPETPAPETVVENIETVLRLERAAIPRRTLADRIADGIAGFAGRVGFVLVHFVWFGFWAAINTGALPVIPAFDPYPFQLLCMIVSMESVILSTFVLIKQNRMGYLSDRRAHLNLQISLLAEREITRMLQIASRLSQRLDVPGAPAGGELSKDTAVEDVARTLDNRLNRET